MQAKYKISPSVLESFRVFKEEIFETSLEDYINGLKEKTETESMKMGSGIHAIMEGVKPEFEFMPEELRQLNEIKTQLPTGINELKLQYKIDDILFSMKVDKIRGNIVDEIKTSKRKYDLDYYFNSVQWKLYLLGTGCFRCYYHIITYNTVRPYTFKYHQPFYFDRFNGMESSIIELSKQFIDFCKFYELEEYIKVK